MRKLLWPLLALNLGVATAAAFSPALVLPLALLSALGTGIVLLTASAGGRRERDAASTAARSGASDIPYDLHEKLAAGTMGEVWRARHRQLDREVALKRIKAASIDQEDKARFEREARVLSSLSSPHTVEVFDFGTMPSGELYFAMELLDGIDLQTAVSEFGPLAPERVVYLLLQACASLKEAHGQGLVHRDIKPANFMICRYGGEFDFLKTLDFGLVKRSARGDDAGITRPAAVLGTAAYLAPESVKGSKFVDGRADLYALGAVGFWLLTGRLLFEEESPMAMVRAHLKDAPPSSSRHSHFAVPPELDALLLECVAKEPSDRPRDAEAVRRRLERVPLVERWDQDRAADWWNTHRAPKDRAPTL
ncbi:MAG TPA: serine/threonine-protein kinase [Polyangiaceae bacterium]|nr:serine/threonine-protein kinase [Polyangiaceae bacterium]